MEPKPERARNMEPKPERVTSRVKNNNDFVNVSSQGVPVTFENDHFRGTVCFRYRPIGHGKGEVDVEGLETCEHWELQVQGRFKTRPADSLWCGARLPSMPLGTNHLLKSMCGMLLSGVTIKKNLDAEILGMPVLHCDRLCRSFHPIRLPVQHPQTKGTWEWLGDRNEGEWYPIQWRKAAFDLQHYYSFRFTSIYADLESWRLTKVPGLGSLDLQTLWGKQSCSLMIFDDLDRCFMQLEFRPPIMREMAIVAGIDSREIEDESSIGEMSDPLFGMECEWNGGGSLHDDEDTDCNSMGFTSEDDDEIAEEGQIKPLGQLPVPSQTMSPQTPRSPKTPRTISLSEQVALLVL